MTRFIWVDLAGHICELALILGMFAIAKGFSAGWVMRIAGSTGWILVALVLARDGIVLTSLMVWPAMFIAIDLFGYRKWTEE